jgi:hypothetical protein
MSMELRKPGIAPKPRANICLLALFEGDPIIALHRWSSSRTGEIEACLTEDN